MEALTPDLQQLVNTALIWVIGAMTALVVSLFSVIGVILWRVARQLIFTANKWREDLAEDTNKLADKLESIANSFREGLDDVKKAISANREEYSGQISGQRERIGIMEKQLEPVDNFYKECRKLSDRLELIEERFQKIIICGKEEK